MKKRSKASLKREADRNSPPVMAFKKKINILLTGVNPQISYSMKKDLASMTDMPFYKDRPEVFKVTLTPIQLLIEYTKIFIKCSDIEFVIKLIRSLNRNQSQTLRRAAPKRGVKSDIWEHVIPAKVVVDEIISMVVNKDISDIRVLLNIYEKAGQIGITKEQNELLKLNFNSSMPKNWNWKDDKADSFVRHRIVGIHQIEGSNKMNITTFLNQIYDSIKVGDMIQKPTKQSEILSILDNGHVYYRIGKTNRKAVTKIELTKIYNILQNRTLNNLDIKEIASSAKPCNVTSIKWLLTNSGMAIEKPKGLFSKNW